MKFIFVITAFILAWFFIEITLFFSNKNFNKLNYQDKIPYKKVIWYFRFIAITLFIMIFLYMYYFDNINFQKLIQYCLGIVK
tara:strand:- start:158 stop:403 length:246 start_codon:yes stop_codon:yes gene_type:complete